MVIGLGSAIVGGAQAAGIAGQVFSLVGGLFAETNVANTTGQLRRVYEVGGAADFGAALVEASEQAAPGDRGEAIVSILESRGGSVIVAGDVDRGNPGGTPSDCAGFNLWVAAINGILGRVRGVSGFNGCGNDGHKGQIVAMLAAEGLTLDAFRQVEDGLAKRDRRVLDLIERIERAINRRVLDRPMLRDGLGIAAPGSNESFGAPTTRTDAEGPAKRDPVAAGGLAIVAIGAALLLS